MLVNLNEVLKKAQKKKYAIGLFNTIDTDMLQAVIEAAEELNSPIIIGTAEVLLPYGDLDLIAPSVVTMAKKANVSVVVHYDHGLTFANCIRALKLGFSSIMFDGSTNDYETNIAQTREIVKIAHEFGATVEGEIGHVGQADNEADMQEDTYTTVEEALKFLNDTGVDALAIAIGTAHGLYKSKPKLNLERLKEIRTATDVPLVLHGGSGLSDDDFRSTIANGIAKINIFTDLCNAGVNSVIESGAKGVGYLEMRDAKMKAIKEAVKEKIRLFGSVDKA